MPFAAVLEREVLPQVADVVAGVKAALAVRRRRPAVHNEDRT